MPDMEKDTPRLQVLDRDPLGLAQEPVTQVGCNAGKALLKATVGCTADRVVTNVPLHICSSP